MEKKQQQQQKFADQKENDQPALGFNRNTNQAQTRTMLEVWYNTLCVCV